MLIIIIKLKQVWEKSNLISCLTVWESLNIKFCDISDLEDKVTSMCWRGLFIIDINNYLL